jgi:hypothetical protein
MSILSIQTNFFGVNRPPKASFLTGRCDVLAPTREDLGFTNQAQALANNIIQIPAVIPGLANFGVVRVTGEPVGEGIATINGYNNPSIYNIIFNPPNQVLQFRLRNVITGELVVVNQNNGNFGGLLFTFFRYTYTLTPSNLGFIGAGSTIADFMLNQRDGLAFASGTVIVVGAITEGFNIENADPIVLNNPFVIGVLAVGAAPGVANNITFAPGPLYGKILQEDAIVGLFSGDVWNTVPPDPLEVTSCIELWS